MNTPMNQSTEICNQLYKFARDQNGQNFWLTLNGVPVLILQNFADADWVLRRNAQNYNKNMAWFRQALGASRFSENGEAWNIRKVLTQHYFNKFDRERTCALAFQYGRTTLSKLVAESQTQSRMNDDTLREMTISVLIENFFGITLAETGINTQNLASIMEYGSEYSFVPAGQTNALYREKLALLPALRRQILEDFKLFRSDQIPSNQMLEGLLKADRDPKQDIVLEHELLTFFAAGAETKAATVGWACYLLAKHPDVQAMLSQEVQKFWAQDQHDWAMLSTLKGLTAFISEALRLYPPTPIIARLSIDADRIGEETIQANQNILISFIGIQHDARMHSDPWHLNMGEALKTPHTRKGSGINTAFSFGPRVCGGKHFALVELAGFLSVFLAEGQFELTTQAPPVFFWKSQMLHKDGQPVRVTFKTKSV